LSKRYYSDRLLVKENFTATLISYADQVMTANPEAHKAQVEAARQAGEPIITRDKANMQEAIQQGIEEAIAHAEETPTPEPEREPAGVTA
jgi:hypothetical protein